MTSETFKRLEEIKAQARNVAAHTDNPSIETLAALIEDLATVILATHCSSERSRRCCVSCGAFEGTSNGMRDCPAPRVDGGPHRWVSP